MSNTKRNVSIPTIHMNGTSAESLINDAMAAYQAVGKALDAMRHVTPNLRDYYIKGEKAGLKARNDHAARQKMLSDIREDLETIITGIQDQERERRRK